MSRQRVCFAVKFRIVSFIFLETHNNSVQCKGEPTHFHALCSVSVSSSMFLQITNCCVRDICFIFLWCLTAQRKGMVICMEISTSLNIYSNFVESYEEAIKRAYDCGFLCFDFNPIDYLIMRQRGTAILRFRQAITIFPVSAMAEASRNWRSFMRSC